MADAMAFNRADWDRYEVNEANIESRYGKSGRTRLDSANVNRGTPEIVSRKHTQRSPNSS